MRYRGFWEKWTVSRKPKRELLKYQQAPELVSWLIGGISLLNPFLMQAEILTLQEAAADWQR